MKLSIRNREAIWAYIFIIIPIVFFICVRIIPTLYAFNVSMHSWDLLSKDRPFIFIDNFKELFKDKVFAKSMVNTAKYVLIGVPLQLSISLIIALLLNRLSKGAEIFRMIFFLPYVTSAVAVSWVWKWLFMKQGGIVNHLIGFFGVSQQPFLNDTTQAIYVVIGNVIWQAIGFSTIIFIAGIKQIPKTYYEAAEIDGASFWLQFKKITVPLLNPTVVYLTVMGTIQTLQVFTQVYNIAGAGGGPLNSTKSLVLYIYEVAFVNYKMGLASAATVILFAIILIITLVQLKLFTKKFEY